MIYDSVFPTGELMTRAAQGATAFVGERAVSAGRRPIFKTITNQELRELRRVENTLRENTTHHQHCAEPLMCSTWLWYLHIIVISRESRHFHVGTPPYH